MNYLFIDGSDNDTFAQVGTQNKRITKTWNTKRNLGAKIPALCQEILSEAELDKKDIDVFVVGTGPGSLTGLRVVAGFLRTCAFLAKKPVIGIDLFSWAIQSLQDTGKTGAVCLMMPTLIDKAFFYKCELPLKLENHQIKPELGERNQENNSDSAYSINAKNSVLPQVELLPQALDKLIKSKIKELSYDFHKNLEVLPMYVIPSQAERNFKGKL